MTFPSLGPPANRQAWPLCKLSHSALSHNRAMGDLPGPGPIEHVHNTKW